MKIYGFSLLKNGVKYDYCFRESFGSLKNLVDGFYLALGDSEDSTVEEIEKLNFIKVINTKWDHKLREGGLILSQQTNVALENLRKDFKGQSDAWGMYIQADEVLHESEIDIIKSDFKKADEGGYDCISFRYFHFWQSHHEVAINKKWYPQEIRGVKLHSEVESWGDAQSFRKYKKIFYSNATIYHYGHVRTPEKYLEKKKNFLKLYHLENKLKKYTRRENRYDRMTKVLKFWGAHPRIMKNRILTLNEAFEAEIVEKVQIITGEETLPEYFLKKIRAQSLEVVKEKKSLKKLDKSCSIFLKPRFYEKFFFGPSVVPRKMENPKALEWPLETYCMFLLSQKGIGVN